MKPYALKKNTKRSVLKQPRSRSGINAAASLGEDTGLQRQATRQGVSGLSFLHQEGKRIGPYRAGEVIPHQVEFASCQMLDA